MLRSIFPPANNNGTDDSQISGKESAAEHDSSPFIKVFPAEDSKSAEGISEDCGAETSQERSQKRRFEQLGEDVDNGQDGDSQRTNVSITSQILDTHSVSRHETYDKVVGNVYDGEWNIAPLLSIDGHHSVPEKEL
ncbi:hypothetical protein K4F52_007703 [Lecanicillium sp. MT-2017a]|nr:hypothetical protein K4F52_007703 [Lecanicillium sp. MT-2017a]